jgi:hypothetical protein
MIKAFIKRLVPTPIKRLIPYSIIENFGIALQNFNFNPPIIVYQMGKVGSKTIYMSLKNAHLPNPIYHVHFLSHDGIRNAEEYILSKKSVVPSHIRRGKILRKKIDKTKDAQWKIITLVREPVIRDISSLFENLELLYPDLIDENGDMKKSDAIEFLQKRLMNYDESTSYTCKWFDREIKSVFSIDVYAYPFNHHDGFTIIHDKGVEVLVLRLEDLDKSFNNALIKFLDLESPIKMLKSNVGENKKYAVAYRHVLENITLPKSVCAKIYSSKYARHFYSENMRNQFIQKWSK